MKTGTSHFPSYGAAMRYYRPYVQHPVFLGGVVTAKRIRDSKAAGLRSLINDKLNAGEISIGKPALKPEETLSIEDNRYHITSP